MTHDLGRSGTLFALTVRGDSMTGAGTFDRDTVIIRQQQTADDGEMIAALIDEATVKTLSRKGDRVRLIAENPAYDPIEPEEIERSRQGRGGAPARLTRTPQTVLTSRPT